jgi:hypothetical protein
MEQGMNKPIKGQRPNFARSADTELLESMLRRLKIGEALPYDDMSKALGRDVRKHCKSNLTSARNALESEGIIMACVPNEGVIRLDDAQIVATGGGYRQRIRRASQKMLSRLSRVNYEQLSKDVQLQHTVLAAQMGAIHHFSTSATQKKIASHVDQPKATIPLGETLQMFQKGG